LLTWIDGSPYQLRVLEKPEDMTLVEDLQRIIWPGNETDIVPGHILLTFAHSGGIVVGAYHLPEGTLNDQTFNGLPRKRMDVKQIPESQLVGFVFGFPGLIETPDGIRVKHCSHPLGVLPGYRDKGIGFVLKRAQWQLVRNQGIDLITWTYDPLQSRNAYFNLSRLGAVCKTYLRDAYGVMRDGLNIGLASDRFQVDWWLNSNRVNRRLSRNVREKLDLAHFLAAGAEILNPTQINNLGFPEPVEETVAQSEIESYLITDRPSIVLLEIPAKIAEIKLASMELAHNWRMSTRLYFEVLFAAGYLASDFIYLSGANPRSFYVLSDGERTL